MVNEVRIRRPALFCPFCGTQGIFEETTDSAIKGIVKIEFYRCDECGQGFYREAWVNVVLLQLTRS